MFEDQAKKLEVFIIVVVIAAIGIVYALTKQPAVAPSNSDNQQNLGQVQQLVPDSIVRYQGVDGRSALDLLKVFHRVETQNFAGIGEFVKSIDGIEPDSSHFWSFYVNGTQAQEGAGTYMTKNSDIIEWKLEEIKM